MLKSLWIENYALIEKLDISFDDGLTIITGETGAGKSILLGALGMILGQRADTRVLLDHDKKCIIEGSFSIANMGMEKLFSDFELDYDELTTFRREISPQGKTRAFINDTPVNLSQMKEIAERLIDIHSQHQNLVIAKSAFRYDLLDAFAGTTLQVSKYRLEFFKMREQNKKLQELLESEKQTRSDLDYFQFQYDELFKAGLNADEFQELESELEILNNLTEINEKLGKAMFLLETGPENLLSALSETLQLFRSIEHYSPVYKELSQRIHSAEIELSDIAAEINQNQQSESLDVYRRNEMQERYDLLQKLMHKHNVSGIEDLIELRDSFKKRIDSFESLEQDIEYLQKELQAMQEQLQAQALKLSQARAKAIPGLEKQINSVLRELGMPNSRFVVQQKSSQELMSAGLDHILFLFSANAGSVPQELEKVASGGELSRLMLAVKSVISMKNLLPTIIFDEIDTGVSGEIGFKMGDILAKISHTMQVISITHLPQVAAKGKKHFVVYKTTDNNHTKTLVKRLSEKDRVIEIAKMLGGENPSATVLQTAEELIQNQSIHKN